MDSRAPTSAPRSPASATATWSGRSAGTVTGPIQPQSGLGQEGWPIPGPGCEGAGRAATSRAVLCFGSDPWSGAARVQGSHRQVGGAVRRWESRRRSAALVGSLLAGVAGAGPASADGPGAGAPWVVSLGDSYVSGEAGRWAGSTNLSSRRVDALGPTAYDDNAAGTAEQIRGCHRSRSAEGAIGGGVRSLDLACSGAKASTYTAITGHFKPGLDFADEGPERAGAGGDAADVRPHARRPDGAGRRSAATTSASRP